MAGFHSDCTERRVCACFERMGHFIGSHPWCFLIVPLVLSMSLGSGFRLLRDRMSTGIEEQFTPVDGEAKTERKYIQETFPGNETTFSRLRLSTDGNYATLIATSDGDILSVEALQDVLDLDIRVRSMMVHHGNQSFEHVDVCAEVMGSCVSNDVLDIIEYDADKVRSINLTFPWHHSGNRSFPLYLSLGSVKLHKHSSVVQSAKAIQLHYYLREDNRAGTDLWLQGFIHLLSNASSVSIQVSRTYLLIGRPSINLLNSASVCAGVVLHLHVDAVGTSESSSVRHLAVLRGLCGCHRVLHSIVLEVSKAPAERCRVFGLQSSL